MKTLSKILTGSMLLCGLLPVTQAAEVKVTWQEPDEYRDIDAASQSRASFRKSVFKNLEDYFNELAQDLPEGAVWDITVTDIDLAGQVWPASFVGFGSTGGEIRVVKQIDIPRMSFSYTLKDANGDVLNSADVSIKDMGFMDGLVQRNRWDNLRYEKRMLKDWFNEELVAKQLSKQ